MSTTTKKRKKNDAQYLSEATIIAAQSVSLMELAPLLGFSLEGRGNVKTLCPVHYEDTPSLNINEKGNFFKCHGSSCGIGGGPVQLYCYHQFGAYDSTYYIKGVEGVCDVMGIPITYRDGSSKETSGLPRNYSFTRKEEPQSQVDQSLAKAVNLELIRTLTLDERHRHDLLTMRKMSDEAIRLRHYRSFPNKPWTVANQLKDKFSTFEGVPGFFQQEDSRKNGSYYWTMSGVQGIMIPVLNEKYEVMGFQNRVDRPIIDAVVKVENEALKDRIEATVDQDLNLEVSYDGQVFHKVKVSESCTVPIVASGKILGEVKVKPRNKYLWFASPNKHNGTGVVPSYHVAVPTSFIKEKKLPIGVKRVGITEGPLKADIAAEKTGHPFIGIPGVSNWLLGLKGALALDAEEYLLAIDADALLSRVRNRQTGEVKEDVSDAIIGLAKGLHEAGKRVYLAAWDIKYGKGIDDLYNNHYFPIEELI